MDMKYVDSNIKQIEDMTREVEVGKVYTGTVKRIEAYGVFVELWDGVSGLCHISRLANERVNKCEDVVSVGDTILVKVIKVNDKGQIDLSRKDALNNSETKEEK
jgi:polyribonucleotide nucleotidyltransferase